MFAQLSQRDPRELTIAAVCIVVISVAALAIYVVKPFWLSSEDAAQRMELLEGFSAQATTPADAIASLRQEIARLEQNLDGDRASLPLQEMESFVIGRLQTIAWRHNLQLKSIEPTRGELTDDYQELLFQVTLSGGYFDLEQWLLDLQKELGFVVVREFQLRRESGSAFAPVLGARFLLASYRMEAKAP